MIYTYTLNPSIDYVMNVDTIQFGATNRSHAELFKTGGKGINVSIVLNNLGVTTITSGFLGGFSGLYIQEDLKQYKHITTDFVHTEGPTRINIKLKQEVETEINGSGQLIDATQLAELWQQIHQLPNDAFVVLSGSLAKGVPNTIYLEICQYLAQRNIAFVIDTASSSLLDIAPFKPVLLKPNQDELEALFQTSFVNDDELIEAGKKLLHAGAQHVIISLGGKGSILITETAVYRATVPKGKLIDSVGAGDSMIAGFVYGITQQMDIVDSFRYAAASGSATAYSAELGTQDAIEQLYKEITINKL